jgi:uncharacterized protein YjiS (DUF1127 family)
MAVIPLNEHRVRRRNPIRASSEAENPIVATFREWRRRAHERAQLARLDDHMLQDIGLTRADAEFLINKPFWRE